MNEKKFMEEIVDFMEFEEDATMESKFREKSDNWDSMKAFALISYLEDEYEKELSFDELKGMKTFKDLFVFANKTGE